MTPKITKTEEKVMLVLTGEDAPIMTKDLAERIEADHYNLSRTLKQMYEDKKIQRYYGPGRSYMWGAPGKRFRDLYKPRRNSTGDPLTKNRPTVNPETLRGLFNSWSSKRWHPKVFDSAPNLPLALGKLFELSAEVGFGSVIPQKELNHYRDKLELLVEDALQLYLISSAILAKSELWGADSLPVFLLTDQTNPIELQELAKKLRELNT